MSAWTDPGELGQVTVAHGLVVAVLERLGAGAQLHAELRLRRLDPRPRLVHPRVGQHERDDLLRLREGAVADVPPYGLLHTPLFPGVL
ncbi:hypothetical protein GCM10010304_82820 [Streptomyces roseoviolaceus]